MANDYQWNEEFTTQKAQVRRHLLDGKTITQLEALQLFKSLRLSAIIFDLRKEGLEITMERIQVSPRKRCGMYFIPKNKLEELNARYND